MITAFRIVKQRHAAAAFDGEGARLYGGRWNSPGVAIVYTADSASLAALEILVHVRETSLVAYVIIACTFSDKLVEKIDRRNLPPPAGFPAAGDRWVRGGSSAVLQVPSIVVDRQSNYLINPRHRDFKSIRIARPQPFEFDVRLLRS